jgi:superfamily II DNA/RNA helicase
VTHVVNYECPEDEKAYLHRIGRTGRAGRDGVAVTFVDWNDLHRWKTINDALHLDFAEPLETYSTSEHLYTALRIPAGAAGVLPRAQRARLGLEAESLEDIGETGKTRSRGTRDGGRTGLDGRGGTAGPRDGAQRKQRSRRRTRGGQPADASDRGQGASSARLDGTGPDGASDDTAGARGADLDQASTAPESAIAAERADGQSRRRPRRRRPARGRSGPASAAQAPSGQPADPAE